ncbi:MAG: type II toxin-antitoxin system MqsA family antitoxin [Opitutaceae bacterium]|jgi:putative transcriptional regulator|nr:type II toxin-antitoxin system MqsA family antitoxin [Opitutaceae bacterium]
MNDKDFEGLLEGVRQLKAALKGDKNVIARVDRIEPDSVAAIRAKLRLSQTEFSNAFGISCATLRNWEQGRRQPTGPARALLRVAQRHPKAVLESVL